ncbi:MAG: ferritin [Acidobacteriota bacterium]|nr:ferritin [Acidobacteriota bacterium]
MTSVVLDAINRQICSEFGASFSYLSMSAWCEKENFTGAAHWLRLQSEEEHSHAMKLFDFVLARGGEVTLETISVPKAKFSSLLDVFETALAQEQAVSKQIDGLYELAFKEKVFAAMAELQWFLTEQVEEEKTARDIVARLKMVGKDPASVIDIDRDLGGRASESAAKSAKAD